MYSNYSKNLSSINNLSKEERNKSITELANLYFFYADTEKKDNITNLIVDVITEFELKKTDLKWNEKMKVLRKKHRYSQEKAARECNVTRKTYWTWEKGVSYPIAISQIAIANAFHVNVEDIFDII